MEKMSKPQAHISKSNQANPDLLLKLRKDLTRKGYEFKEFQGGNYKQFIEGAFDNKPTLFVISHPECFADGTRRVNLGRGIFGEAHTAMVKECKIIAVSKHGYTVAKSVHQYDAEELKKTNAWQLRYGYLELENAADKSNETETISNS